MFDTCTYTKCDTKGGNITNCRSVTEYSNPTTCKPVAKPDVRDVGREDFDLHPARRNDGPAGVLPSPDWPSRLVGIPFRGAGVALVTAAINRNFGSATVPVATMLTGGVGLTVTASDGVNFIEILTPPVAHSLDLDGIVLPPNASIAVTLVPPAGNGDMDVNVALQMYELTDAI